MRYRVSVDGLAWEACLTPDGLELGDVAAPIELATLPGTPLRHLRLGDRGLPLVARPTESGWEILLEGRAVRVEVEDERARAIRQVAGQPPPRAPRALRAPMPGLIVRVEVEPGQRVEAGTPIVAMEAMKMENELRASGPGTIAAVEVQPGQTVERDAVLVRFE